MSTVLGLFRATITRADGTFVNLAQATDFTSIQAETRDFAPSGDTTYTFVDTVIARIKDRVGATGLSVELLGRNRLADPLELLASFDLSLDDLPCFCDVESKVFYRLRFQDVALTKRWNLFGIQAFGEPDGQFF